LLGALAATLYSLTGADDVDALLTASEEVFSIERRRGRLTWFSAEAHFLRYHGHLHCNDRSAADRALGDFGEVVGRLRLPEPLLLYHRLCAQRIFDEGRLAEAEELFVEQHARGKRLGLGYADLYFGLHRMMVRWERRGLSDLRLPPASEGWEITSAPVFGAMRLFTRIQMGGGPALKHDWELLCQDDFAAIPRDMNYLLALSLLASMAVELRDVPRARVLYDRLAPYVRFGTTSLLTLTTGSVAHFLAMLAELLDERRTAAAYYETAIADNDRMGYVPWAARSRVRYASLLLREGSAPARARELLHDAREVARRLGLGPIGQSTEALLERSSG
jgi:hypothetical protein